MIDSLIEEMNVALPLHGQAYALVDAFKPLLDDARPHLSQEAIPPRQVGESQIVCGPALTPDQAEWALGQTMIDAISRQLNLAPEAVAAAATFVLPRMAELFAPGEPAAPIAAEVAPAAAPALRSQALLSRAALAPAGVSPGPARRATAAPEQSGKLGWLLPVILVLATAGLVWRFSERPPPRPAAPVPTVVALAPAPLPEPALALRVAAPVTPRSAAFGHLARL